MFVRVRLGGKERTAQRNPGQRKERPSMTLWTSTPFGSRLTSSVYRYVGPLHWVGYVLLGGRRAHENLALCRSNQHVIDLGNGMHPA